MCWSIDPSSCTLIIFAHQINLGGTRGVTAHFINFWILLGISSILHILQQAPCGNDRCKFIMVDGMNKYIPKPKNRSSSFPLTSTSIRSQENGNLINYCRRRFSKRRIYINFNTCGGSFDYKALSVK